MRLYNTLTRKYEELDINNDTVKIYLCGVTVYDDSHIGHARTIIIFDTLHRYLKSLGFNVKFIQNFTDIDDKIINRSKKLEISPMALAEKYIQKYFVDFSRLNILSEIIYPKATDNIQNMINLISNLLENEYAYITLNGVYFHVKNFREYGKLSKKTYESLEAGARVEIDPTKQDPLDFALWKFHRDEPVWDSPWGKGRPGWHIECSAMALKFLGNTIDIHGGGNDLIFPHHENEIAQSEAVTKEQFAKIWMHSGMVNINSAKMSKSLGNIISVENAIQKWGANTIRVLCLSTQYSKPLDYSYSNLSEALAKWRLVENCYYELKFPLNISDHQNESTTENEVDEILAKIKKYLDDDLNTPMALSVFMKFVSELNDKAAKEKITNEFSRMVMPIFEEIMNIFGLKVIEPSIEEVTKITEMINQRNKLRSEKNFKDADNLRLRLKNELNVELIDYKNNRTVWKKTEKQI